MYLITGATGRLGRLVVENTVDRVGPNRVVAACRRPSPHLEALGVTTRHADYDDLGSLAEAFAGIDRVLLISSSANPHELRFQHHAAVVEAAVRAGVGHLVYTSLFEKSPESIGGVHRRTEKEIVNSGLAYTFMRHPLYTDNFLDGVLADPELVSSTGRERVATATRSDLAEAAAVVLTGEGHEGRTYALNGPAWNYDELVAELSAHTGRAFTHRAVDAPEFARLLTEEGVPDPLHGILCDIHATMATGALAAQDPDLARLLGRAPTPMPFAVRTLAS